MDNETTSNPEQTVEQAAEHIAGLLDLRSRSEGSKLDLTPTDDDKKRAPEAAPPAGDDPEFTPSDEDGDDVGAEGTPPTDDPDDGTPDPVEEPDEDSPPAIDPPTSWPADQRARFKELPPDLQQFVVARESERDRSLNQKVSQLAEQRRQAEAEVAKVNQTQQTYYQVMEQMLQMTVPELTQIEQTDFVHLAQTDPTEYVRLSAVRDGLRQRVGYMQQQMQQVQTEQQQRALASHQEHLQHQYHALIDQVPEFGNPTKAKEIVNDIANTMSKYGFTDDELNSIADARIVRVLSRLASLEKREAARVSAQSKKTPATPGKSTSPNAINQTRDTSRKSDLQNQYNRLRKTGSVYDAARIIANMT